MEQNQTVPQPGPQETVATELQPGQAAPSTDGVALEPAQQQNGAPQEGEGDEGAGRPNRFQQRFSTLTTRAQRAEQEAAYWRGIAEGRGLTQATPQQTQPTMPAAAPQNAGNGAPDPSQFALGEFDPNYIAAVARHAAREERLAIERENREAAELATRRQRWEGSVAEAEAEGLDGAIEFLNRADISIVDVVTASPAPALVAEYLAQYPDDARALLRLDPASRAVRVGYIAANLQQQVALRRQQAPRPSQPAPQTSAPTQTQPLQATHSLSGGGVVHNRDPSQMSMDEYKAWRLSGS